MSKGFDETTDNVCKSNSNELTNNSQPCGDTINVSSKDLITASMDNLHNHYALNSVKKCSSATTSTDMDLISRGRGSIGLDRRLSKTNIYDQILKNRLGGEEFEDINETLMLNSKYPTTSMVNNSWFNGKMNRSLSSESIYNGIIFFDDESDFEWEGFDCTSKQSILSSGNSQKSVSKLLMTTKSNKVCNKKSKSETKIKINSTQQKLSSMILDVAKADKPVSIIGDQNRTIPKLLFNSDTNIIKSPAFSGDFDLPESEAKHASPACINICKSLTNCQSNIRPYYNYKEILSNNIKNLVLNQPVQEIMSSNNNQSSTQCEKSSTTSGDIHVSNPRLEKK